MNILYFLSGTQDGFSAAHGIVFFSLRLVLRVTFQGRALAKQLYDQSDRCD